MCVVSLSMCVLCLSLYVCLCPSFYVCVVSLSMCACVTACAWACSPNTQNLTRTPAPRAQARASHEVAAVCTHRASRRRGLCVCACVRVRVCVALLSQPRISSPKPTPNPNPHPSTHPQPTAHRHIQTLSGRRRHSLTVERHGHPLTLAPALTLTGSGLDAKSARTRARDVSDRASRHHEVLMT